MRGGVSSPWRCSHPTNKLIDCKLDIYIVQCVYSRQTTIIVASLSSREFVKFIYFIAFISQYLEEMPQIIYLFGSIFLSKKLFVLQKAPEVLSKLTFSTKN